MNILNLPIELGVIILKYLDLKSKIHLYNSCDAIKRYFAPQHLKKVILSRKVIANVNTLNQHMFKELGYFIRELNLKGIPDLRIDILKPHMDYFSNLHTLDVTFTNIYLSDVIEICPRYLKNISINFFKYPRQSNQEDIWEKCKQLFQAHGFDRVHFIVFDFQDSDAPLRFMEGIPTVQHLQITVADNYKDFCNNVEESSNVYKADKYTAKFVKLAYMFRDCRVTHKTTSSLRGVVGLDFKLIEYIFIMYLEKIYICVSPVFKSLFLVNCSDLKVEVSDHLPLGYMLDGNIVFKAWDKSAVVFDEKFMKDLLLELKDYFPTYICMQSRTKRSLLNAPSDWYCIDACDSGLHLIEDSPRQITLTDYCRKDGVVIRRDSPVHFCCGTKIFKNLSFLRLNNVHVKVDFFNALFIECPGLETLDVYIEKRGRSGPSSGFTLPFSKTIALAKTLKNFKLTSEDVEYEELFDGLSECETMENIHICEYERTMADDIVNASSIESVIKNCSNLYSLFIEADMSPENLTLLISPLRDTAQRLKKDYLCIEVCDCYRGWNPFFDVFSPSPLHILD